MLALHEEMIPEKNIVSLIVEGDSASPFEVWVLTEDGGKHAPQSVSQACAKVIQDELWSMRACSPVVLHTYATTLLCHFSLMQQLPHSLNFDKVDAMTWGPDKLHKI